MDIEEVHIYRDLQALTFNILRLVHLFNNDNFSIGHRCDDIIPGSSDSVGNTEKEEEGKTHECNRKSTQGI